MKGRRSETRPKLKMKAKATLLRYGIETRKLRKTRKDNERTQEKEGKRIHTVQERVQETK